MVRDVVLRSTMGVLRSPVGTTKRAVAGAVAQRINNKVFSSMELARRRITLHPSASSSWMLEYSIHRRSTTTTTTLATALRSEAVRCEGSSSTAQNSLRDNHWKQQQQRLKQQERYFSTDKAASAPPPKESSKRTSKTKRSKPIILFDRNAERHSYWKLQGGIIASTLNLGLWIFLDHIYLPFMVNSSTKAAAASNAAAFASATSSSADNEAVAAAASSIEPTFGYLWHSFSLSIWVMTVLYPRALVSRLEYNPSNESLLLYNHAVFPFVRPALLEPKVVAPVGQLVLNERTRAAEQLEKELGYDIRDIRGSMPLSVSHELPLKYHTLPAYMLNIQSADDVPEPEYLVAALLYPNSLSFMVNGATSNDLTEKKSKSGRMAAETSVRRRGGVGKRSSRRR